MSEQMPHDEGEHKDAWQEVGRQFQRLGESLATAFQTTIKDESTRQNMKDLQDGLENAVQGIRNTVQKGVSELEGQNFGEQARQAAESLKTAGEQTVEEVRPHLLSALQQLNRELDQLVQTIQSKPAQPPKEDDQPKE
ncbi:hypothetical protein LARV_01560 [Longilinea arvoryzae]|uniref:Uncharacterized protein n=1 Tax=Longilinea arvoryzae TaxID=360412 RepID=A0A0S7BE70_9CHLR|nr:hypothetical protein [Longilinea arvoryzae]GAP13805.1 hypothetical protein LARV_01560 [Longilinea arvoryzae]